MRKLIRGAELLIEQRWRPSPIQNTGESAPEPVEDAIQELEPTPSEAELIISEAHTQAESLRQQARDEGYAEGHAQALREYDVKMNALEALIAEINQEREAFYIRIEPELVRLSTVIADKVLAHQVTVAPEVVVDITRTVMKRLRERDEIHIRCNPKDYPLLEEARPALLHEVDGVREIILFDDRRIARGGVVVEGKNGTLDARFPAQMDIIQGALNDALGGPGEPTGH